MVLPEVGVVSVAMSVAEYSNWLHISPATQNIQFTRQGHMTALLLPFAKRLSDDKLVSPDEVERGGACKCICPGCNMDVLAKQGTEREWHFAHAKGKKCDEGYEVSIHELAKQMLRHRMELLLPSLVAKTSGIDAYGRLLEEQEPILQSQFVKLEECITGKNLNGIHVDALGTLKGHRILIEVTVFHRLMPDKQARLIKTEIPSIQIDLGQFKSRQATRELLEKAIFEDENVRKWIYHPKYDSALEKAQAKLDGRLQESKAGWQKDEALRKEQAALIRQKPVSAGWNLALSAACKESPPQWRSLMLSSALPSAERIELSANKLAMRAGISEELVLSGASAYTSRGQLRGFTSESFVVKWSELLNLPENEVENFLVDAGYLLRC